MARKFLAIAVLAPLAVACAPWAASSAPVLNDAQQTLVQSTCDRVMGLKSGGLYRSQCMESLSRSLARKLESAALVDGTAACARQGLAQGSPSLATCVLDRQQASASAAVMTPARLSYDASMSENMKGYFDVPSTARRKREQYSCAQLGLMPGSRAFGQCVASLDADLFNPD